MDQKSRNVDQPDQQVSEKIKVSVTLSLPKEVVNALELLKREYGVGSKGRVLEMLLEDLILGEDSEPSE